MYGHGKLDLKFVYGRAENRGWKQQDLSKRGYGSEVEISPMKIIKSRVLEKKVCLLADTFTLVSYCYRE